MENKSKKTKSIIGIALIILIGMVVWSMIDTRSKWKHQELGIAEYGQGNYKNAIKHFTSGIASNPGNASLYNNRGLAYFKLKEYKKALSDYDKALELNTDFAVAYCNRGLAHFKSTSVPGTTEKDQIYNKAIIDFTKAIALDPKQIVDAYYNRGLTYNQSIHYYRKPFTDEVEGTYQKALSDFDRTLALDPGYALAFAGKGNAYYRHGDWNTAEEEYNKAIELKDKIVEKWGKNSLAGVFSSRARNYIALNELEKSGSDYEKVLELDPRSTAPSGHGASVWFQLKNYDKLIEAYNKIIDLIENDSEFKNFSGIGRSYAGRAKTYYLLGQYDKAIADYHKALSSGSAEGHGYSITEVHRYLGKTYLSTGKRQAAENELEKAIKLYGDKTDSKIKRVASGGYTGRGACWIDLEEYENAISDFENTLALNTPFDAQKDRGYAEAHKNLGLVYWKMGQMEKANEYLNKAAGLFEDSGKKYQAKELKEALKTGDVKDLFS
ncbi:tetratricopeptide repeat protein [Desulfosarcina ovata]|uniref:Uncharacterized protein n=1 Tax=Desulfosarcina ovata subsp. ovata TaxID=2752305 RepID=A0A5K8A939_9BACT|nr:tetratricopeptide repeat protein [Desulfosarcina ovata]BBO89172.1 hypothetical protein DSCOOX_23520 [Desulfosarcina ovata subsp. ovata]